MPHVYYPRSSFKAILTNNNSSTDTADDARMDAVLTAVSRQIDQYCGRWFFPAVQTRYFTTNRGDLLRTPNLLSITSLQTDYDGDQVYETTWAASDYLLDPADAPFFSPPEPFMSIEVPPYPATRKWFPQFVRGVKIVGTFGFYDQSDTASATVSGAFSSAVTALVVSAAAEFEPLQTLLIGSEQIQIVSISGTTLTVKRGQNGTTAAGISNGAAISIYSYPVISEACLIQSSRIFKRKDSPYGIVGGGEFGPMRIARLDPDVREMLEPFRRAGFA